MTFQDVLLKIAQGVAVGVTVGGGSMVLSDHVENATQRRDIDSLNATVQRIDSLRDQMATLNSNMAVLNARLEAGHVRPRDQ